MRPVTMSARDGRGISESAHSQMYVLRISALPRFAMIRGSHVDVTILGAMEVAANGDLANWTSSCRCRCFPVMPSSACSMFKKMRLQVLVRNLSCVADVLDFDAPRACCVHAFSSGWLVRAALAQIEVCRMCWLTSFGRARCKEGSAAQPYTSERVMRQAKDGEVRQASSLVAVPHQLPSETCLSVICLSILPMGTSQSYSGYSTIPDHRTDPLPSLCRRGTRRT